MEHQCDFWQTCSPTSSYPFDFAQINNKIGYVAMSDEYGDEVFVVTLTKQTIITFLKISDQKIRIVIPTQ